MAVQLAQQSNESKSSENQIISACMYNTVHQVGMHDSGASRLHLLLPQQAGLSAGFLFL